MFGRIRLMKAWLWFSIFSSSVLVTLIYLLLGIILCNSFHENVSVTCYWNFFLTRWCNSGISIGYGWDIVSNRQCFLVFTLLSIELLSKVIIRKYHKCIIEFLNRNIVMWFHNSLSDCLYGPLDHVWESPYWNPWIFSLLSRWLYGAWYIIGKQKCCAYCTSWFSLVGVAGSSRSVDHWAVFPWWSNMNSIYSF